MKKWDVINYETNNMKKKDVSKNWWGMWEDRGTAQKGKKKDIEDNKEKKRRNKRKERKKIMMEGWITFLERNW